MAIDETGRGVCGDKITKNMFATEYIYHSIKYEKTVGVIEDNDLEDYEVLAEPVGVICGATPVTNPTSITLFKSIISVKERNPIIFGFHPSVQKCSAEAARIVRDAAIAAGTPENCIQWMEYPSLEATNTLMNHPRVSMVLAAGGAGMVKAAYSTGKPALGVGPGNVPCYIHKSADLEQAFTDLILSKSFDNGMICASKHPDVDFNGLALRFLDIRKRVFKFPTMGNKAKMVAISTTSGIASEVTSFAVISDKKNNMKYPLADYEMTSEHLDTKGNDENGWVSDTTFFVLIKTETYL